MTKPVGASVEDMAREYVETLNSPPNGWGQHVHKSTGLASHFYMSKMMNRFGRDVAHDAITKALQYYGKGA